jgi:hypothetical protein
VVKKKNNMSQLNRIIELIRLTNQPGFVLDGDKEPLVILPLAKYEQLVVVEPTGNQAQAEIWSQALQQQIDLWQKEQSNHQGSPKQAIVKSAKKPEQAQSIIQPRPDLAEIMEDIPDEYLPEPLEE